MKKIIYQLVIFISLISCKQDRSEENEAIADKETSVSEIILPESPDQISENSTSTQNAFDNDKKVVKNGILRFETKNINETASKIYAVLKKCNGYVQLDNENKQYNQISRNIIVRVPNQNFDLLVNEVTNGVSYFDEKQITSEDVTEQFIDLEARLKSKKELEARYIDLLKKANKVSDIIEIEQQINQIREEIEVKEGQLNYLKNKISMSTLNITFYKPISEIGTTVSYGDKIVNALKESVSWIPGFFIGLIYVWPLFLILWAIYFFIRRKVKNKK